MKNAQNDRGGALKYQALRLEGPLPRLAGPSPRLAVPSRRLASSALDEAHVASVAGVNEIRALF